MVLLKSETAAAATYRLALIECAYPSLSDNKVRKVLVKYKNQGEGGFRFSERPSNKIVLVVPYEDQQYDSEQFKGVQSSQESEPEAAEAGEPLMEAAEAGEPLMEAAVAGEPLMEAAKVGTRPQRKVKEIPRDSSYSSENAATDEEDESATGTEAGQDAAPVEAERITPPPEPGPTGHAAEVNPSDGVASEDLSRQVPSTRQDWASRLRSLRARRRPVRYQDPDIYKY